MSCILACRRLVERRVRTSILCCLGVVLNWPAIAGNWYDTDTRKCEWISPAADVIPNQLKRDRTKAGGDYVSVPKSQLNAVLAVPSGNAFVGAPLSTAELASLRGKVEDARSSPMAAKIALLLAGKVTDFSGVFGVAVGTLLDWLGSNADAKLVNIDRFVDFIAVGGTGGQELSFRIPPVGSKPLLYVAAAYEIQVGTEPRQRRWMLSACLIPIEVVLAEVETTAAGPNANNKKLIKQADGAWRMWDVTDNKYDSYVMRYDSQDEQFAYFVVTSQPDTEFRVHLYGGPMQRRSGGGAWATLYPTVETR